MNDIVEFALFDLVCSITRRPVGCPSCEILVHPIAKKETTTKKKPSDIATYKQRTRQTDGRKKKKIRHTEVTIFQRKPKKQESPSRTRIKKKTSTEEQQQKNISSHLTFVPTTNILRF
jgi:chromatin segregation and condensation protein Rec8/ScpA/Scc1 (kleisin family)